MVSHLLYTQEGVLDDTIPAERAFGIEAGLAWGAVAQVTVVYTDRGISRGMKYGIERAQKEGRSIEYRTLPGYRAAKKRKVFVICPVRNVDDATKERIEAYVHGLEKLCHLHWPYRDTNQNDQIGIAICKENRGAIYEADEIHIWFDEKSQGSLFDIGMTFAFLRETNKKIVLINRENVQPTPHKSFANVLLALAWAFR